MVALCVSRDDVIFLIYLYQRYIYRVDMKRVNEFGWAGEVRGASQCTLRSLPDRPPVVQGLHSMLYGCADYGKLVLHVIMLVEVTARLSAGEDGGAAEPAEAEDQQQAAGALPAGKSPAQWNTYNLHAVICSSAFALMLAPVICSCPQIQSAIGGHVVQGQKAQRRREGRRGGKMQVQSQQWLRQIASRQQQQQERHLGQEGVGGKMSSGKQTAEGGAFSSYNLYTEVHESMHCEPHFIAIQLLDPLQGIILLSHLRLSHQMQ
jgi:hypothetical protein